MLFIIVGDDGAVDVVYNLLAEGGNEDLTSEIDNR